MRFSIPSILPIIIATIFYFVPFFFAQLISPFILVIALGLVFGKKDSDKILLALIGIFLYWISLQGLSLEMDQADNLIDTSVQLPPVQIIHGVVIFIGVYIICKVKNKDLSK